MTTDARVDMEEVRAALETLPEGPWEVWSSCSFRRITGPDGKDGGVLSAYRQRSDGHPDLSMTERQLEALCKLRNAAPALLAECERMRDAQRQMTEGVRLIAVGCGNAVYNLNQQGDVSSRVRRTFQDVQAQANALLPEYLRDKPVPVKRAPTSTSGRDGDG